MKVQSLRQADLKNKTVLVRVDFNVPLEKNIIMDDTRMQRTLPTLRYLVKQKAKIVLLSHLGRPDGKKVKSLQLDPVGKHLSTLLKQPVRKMDECTGLQVEKTVKALKPGEIVLLENTRFYPEEEKCSRSFSKKLAALADVFIIDSFGTAHRKHATTYGIAEYLPSYAGFLLEEEVKILGALMEQTVHPLTFILGGAKIDTKIGLLRNFLPKADYFLMGGGLANTFLAAAGHDVGSSLYQKDKVSLAQEIMLEAEALKKTILLPVDVVVADSMKNGSHVLDLPREDVMGDMKIFDIGKRTLLQYKKIIQQSKMVVWNGPVGFFEKEPFGNGTAGLAKILVKTRGLQTLLGGGDTIDAIKLSGFSEDQFTHVSTGGGAMLEFLEGKMLPGVQIVLA